MRLRELIGSGASLNRIGAVLGMPHPMSLTGLGLRISQPLRFPADLVTADGVALAGSHTVTLQRDGAFLYEGSFRATGWNSYDTAIISHLVGDAVVVAFAAHGEVHGTNEPGKREYRWSQQGRSELVRANWFSLQHAELHHDLQYDVDVFGSAGAVASSLAKAAVAYATAGAGGLLIVLGSETLSAVDENLALPQTVGIFAAGAVLMVGGPGMLLPALVVGIGAGVTANELVKQREFYPEERALASEVFGDQLSDVQILVTNLVGLGGRPFTVPASGDTVLLNLGAGYDRPVTYTGQGGAEMKGRAPGQLFIHELVHAWQIAQSGFLLITMCEGVTNQVKYIGGDSSVYVYGQAGPDWSSFSLEAQGRLVEEWFAGSLCSPEEGRKIHQNEYAPRLESDDNPFFRYVRDNIRAGVT